jgi:hypothetical protein
MWPAQAKTRATVCNVASSGESDEWWGENVAMKNSAAVWVAILSATCALAWGASRAATSTESSRARLAAEESLRQVVVELFTSEGCSSCPPADALLMRLESSQPVKGVKIIALEEHVDYWDHDGWRDPYSSSDWTQRQERYVLAFKEKTGFTPQMIVQGQTEVTRGQQDAEEAIRKAAAQPTTEVSLTQAGSDAEGAQFSVRVGKLSGNSAKDEAEVWLAVTERGLGAHVSAGENAGKDLQHSPVLRSLHKIGSVSPKHDAEFAASPRVKFKPEWKHENLQVVAFVQEKTGMQILGAASLEVAK